MKIKRQLQLFIEETYRIKNNNKSPVESEAETTETLKLEFGEYYRDEFFGEKTYKRDETIVAQSFFFKFWFKNM